jgi:hypothetical protein
VLCACDAHTALVASHGWDCGRLFWQLAFRSSAGWKGAADVLNVSEDALLVELYLLCAPLPKQHCPIVSEQKFFREQRLAEHVDGRYAR